MKTLPTMVLAVALAAMAGCEDDSPPGGGAGAQGDGDGDGDGGEGGLIGGEGEADGGQGDAEEGADEVGEDGGEDGGEVGGEDGGEVGGEDGGEEAGDEGADEGTGEGGEDGGQGCGSFRRLLKPHPPSVARVMLVIDRSYSMIENDDRWTPATEAVAAVADALGEAIRFGLLLFPHPSQRNPPEGVHEACIPGVVNVEPAADRAAEIAAALAEGRPRQDSGTPTAAALQAAGDWLARAPTDHDFILLATDGGPGCNPALDPLQCVCNAAGSNCCVWEAAHNCLDDVATTGIIADLAQRGVRTIVLGITGGQREDGDACGPAGQCGANSRCVYGGQECVGGRCDNRLNDVLDAMAVAGRTDVDGHHLEVADIGQIGQRLAAAAGGVVPCVYALDALAEHADLLTVTVDDDAVPRDVGHINGWDVHDDVIEFYGPACQALRDGQPHEINASCE